MLGFQYGVGSESSVKTRESIRDDLMDDGSSTSALAVDMVENSREAAAFLKALAHEGRLMILCYLNGGEKSVTELEVLLGQRQAAVSQQLARLRGEGLVTYRRDGKAIYYSLADPKTQRTISLLYDLFCEGSPAT